MWRPSQRTRTGPVTFWGAVKKKKTTQNIQMGAFQDLREFRLEFSATRLPCEVTFSSRRSSANTHSVLIQVEPERCQARGDLLVRHCWMKILLRWCFGASSCATALQKILQLQHNGFTRELLWGIRILLSQKTRCKATSSCCCEINKVLQTAKFALNTYKKQSASTLRSLQKPQTQFTDSTNPILAVWPWRCKYASSC